MQQLYHLENLEIPFPFLAVPTEKIVKKPPVCLLIRPRKPMLQFLFNEYIIKVIAYIKDL